MNTSETIVCTVMRELRKSGWRFRRGAEGRLREWARPLPFVTMPGPAIYRGVSAAIRDEELPTWLRRAGSQLPEQVGRILTGA